MKKYLFLFIVGIFTLCSFTSCIPDFILLLALVGGEDFDDGFDTAYYYAKIEFVDAVDGHNLVEGIPLRGVDVARDSYQLSADNVPHEYIGSLYYDRGYMGTHANVSFHFSLEGNTKTSVTYRFLCPYIFGDDKTHVFTLLYEHEHYVMDCISFESEDARFDTWEIDKEENYIVLRVNPLKEEK